MPTWFLNLLFRVYVYAILPEHVYAYKVLVRSTASPAIWHGSAREGSCARLRWGKCLLL